MADIFITEDFEDCVEENAESLSQSPSKQIRVVIQGSVEPQDELSDESSSEDVNKSEKDNAEMTLKQTESESEPNAVDELLVNPDDLLPPVVKLEKYTNSELVFNRQVVARNLLETLRLVQGNNDEVGRVINVLCRISEDYDPSVRTDLMVQVPHLAAFFKDADMSSAIQQYLMPMVINYLGDDTAQVRKSSQSALLTIVEQKLIDSDTIIKKVCPFVIHLTDSIHTEDLRTECIVLMSKLAVLLGKKVTEDLFFEHLFYLCADKANNIRKACASTFGDFCTVVGRELTEEVLLPRFFTLCVDTAWCVRKACTENFMPVSCVVSRETRCKELSSMYMVLLTDQSRWVRLTAYQALGPFISTFAEPEKTGLYYSKEGVLTVVDPPQLTVQNTLTQELSDKKYPLNEDSDELNVDRTISSKSCDSLVLVNNKEGSPTAAEVRSSLPAITCHVGSNYRTVIEVSSPTTTLCSASKDEEVGCAVINVPKENGAHCDSETVKVQSLHTESDTSLDSYTFYLDRKYLGLLENEKAFGKLFHNIVCEKEEMANGDISRGVNGDFDIVDKSVESSLFDNKINSDIETALLSSITVNGVNITSSVLHPETTQCEVKPVVTCSTTDDDKAYLNKSISKNALVAENQAQIELLSHSTASKLSDIQDVPCKISSYESLAGAAVEFEFNHTTDITPTTADDPVKLNVTKDESFHDESAFNYFQYWRTPLPDVDFNVDELCSSRKPLVLHTKSLKKKRKEKREATLFENFMKNADTFVQTVNILTASTDPNPGWCTPRRISENKEGEPPPALKLPLHEQDIVPPELLARYLGMIDDAWAQTIDSEIARHCAYSFPAVALTLGRQNWPCLKETFDALSSDLQEFIMMWKVRRTVASCMHQLAVILGPDITSKDLLPVFSRFINDLDEVRIGVLQHVSEFLKVLRPEERRKFLPSLAEFLVSNTSGDSNEKNWRFRLILADQLVFVADLYEPQDVRDHLVPLTLTLIRDKICEVRLAAVRVMAAVMRRLSQSSTPDLTKAVLTQLTDEFIHAPKWLHRQLYVYICQEFITEKSLSPDQFAEDALPQLLYLCWDRIPNVRIAIARCLSVVIWPLETFSSTESPHRELLLQTIHTLQSDSDPDVRFYANMVSTDECSCLQHGEFTNLGELPV